MQQRSAGEQLLAEIHQESGLSQAELSRRTGMTRSVLSAYARGRRQPGVDALARIAAAVGLELRIGRGSEPNTTAAERMARVSDAWALGAAEGKQLDRRRAQRMSRKERIQEGQALARIAEQLQAGRSVR
jgi:transcriptional regulator with XRE-family HTH domain